MASGGKENLPAAGGAASAGPKAPASQPPSSSAAAQAYASLIASPNAQGGAGSPAVPGSQPAQKAPPRPRAKNAVSTIWGTENLRMVDMEAPARPPSSAQPPPSQAGPNTTAAAVKDYLFQGLFSTTPTAGSSAALQPAGAPPVVNAPEPEGEEDEDIEDELENLQRFTNYEPRLPYGKPHPDPLVEASSLANCPPPPITYTPLMFTNPEARAKAIDSGALSNVQLESIVYACQRHEQKCPDGKTTAGFVVGDGAGVGKGRTIAGIIYENALRGRKKALWVSVSADLHVDAQRDLDDIGADHIAVTNIAKLSYESIRNFDEGVLFSTYSSLVAKRSQKTTLRASGKKLLSSRLEQVIDWLGEDFDGPIVFDESHKAKNLVPPSSKTPAAPNADEDDKIDLSNRADVILELINEAGRGAGQQVKTVTKKGGATQTGIVIAALQERLKKARVVYVSATGVSEVRNLAYMSRMGLWGPGTAFPSGFRDFYDQISKRGEGAMECLALDMKSMGSYLSRTLSYHGATFEVVKVTMDPALLDYDSAAQLWLDARDVFDSWIANNSSQLQSRKITLMQRMYWAAHQRFFRYLCVSSKVPAVIELAQKALSEGKAVVIGLQNTGESNTAKRLEDEPNLAELVSAPKESLIRLIVWYFRHCFFQADEEEKDLDDEDLGLDPFDEPDDDDTSSISSRLPTPPRRHLIRHDVKDEDAADEANVKGEPAVKIKAEPGLVVAPIPASPKDQKPRTRRRIPMDQLPPPSPQRDVKPAVPSSVKVKAEPKAKKNEDADLLDFHLGRSDSSDSGSESASDDDDFVPEKRGSADSSRSGSKRGAGRASRRTMDDSDDSESDNSLPAPRRLKKARGTAKQGPVKKEATLKRKGPVSDDDDEDEPVKHRSSKRMVVADSDDESPRAVPRRHVVPDELQRRPINLDRHLKSLYRLAGSKQAVEAMPHFESMKNLLQKLEDINLPDNALDHLVMALGGPDEVAELTGRKIRAVVSPSGRIVFEKRYGPGTGKTLENMNLREKEQFMNGHKNVAIISDAASAGISLQADKRVPNQRRRVHITLELAWAADKTVQQLGRTHRSNQSSAPEYVLMISDVAGENRFASSVAKRLGSMGALTKGDRKASTGINLTQFNHETRFGRLALEKTYAAIGSSYHQSNYQSSTKALKPDVLPPNMTQQEFFATLQEYMDKLDMAQNDSDMSNVPKFLNRILGLPLTLQNPIFSYFQQQLRAVLSWARKHNKLDKGIEPVGGLYETLALAPGKPVRTVYQDPYTKLETRYLEIVTDRGISFEVANAILQDTENPGPRDGFYVISYEFSSIKHYVLAIEVANDQFKLYKPNIGEIFTLEPWDKTLMRNGKKIKADKMKPLWTERYKFAETKCQHKLGPSGKCSIERVGGHCDHGVRLRRHHLFCGGTMSIWRLVEHAMSYNSGKQRLKIVRTSGENDTVKAIGLAVPSNAVARVLDTLEKQAELDKLKGPGVKLEAYYY